MDSVQLLPIELGELELGLPLRFDILNAEDELLAKAGVRFTESLLSQWSELGFSTVFAKVIGEASEDSALLKPYNDQALMRLDRNLKHATESVRALNSRLLDKQTVNNSEFLDLSGRLLSEVTEDSAQALVALFRTNQAPPSEDDLLLAHRSSMMSLLSMVIAFEMSLPESDCRVVGMAGLLHDVSLIGYDPEEHLDEFQEFYDQHPLKSAYMVETIVGVDPRVYMGVAQVHESPFGDGFPRGLHSNRIMPMARIISLADTYLTLTATNQPLALPVGKKLYSSDAIGYIMFHAKRGRFDLEAVRALIRATSLYPVGSDVLLSDGTPATVIRSTKSDPAKPIVQVAEKSKPKLLDLRFSSVSVTGPLRIENGPHLALRKSQLTNQLWK